MENRTGKVIGVTGALGQLGSELVSLGCVPLVVDVTDSECLRGVLTRAALDVVIHCAALTNVDGCERDPVNAAIINTGGVDNLTHAFAGKIVYISTDYVFDGQRGPYSEPVFPSPINVYGWSKLGGELVLQTRGNRDDLIVRTTNLYSHRYVSNFVMKVVAQLEKGQPVYLPCDLRGNPTYAPHLARDILSAIKAEISGILNLGGMPVLSRFELGHLIAQEWRFDPGLVRPGPDPNFTECQPVAKRPKCAGLKIDKALALGLPKRAVSAALREMRGAMEGNCRE